MPIKKGKKILARYYTYHGSFEIAKFAWICSCGRIYFSRKTALICEKSGHRTRDETHMISSKEEYERLQKLVKD